MPQPARKCQAMEPRSGCFPFSQALCAEKQVMGVYLAGNLQSLLLRIKNKLEPFFRRQMADVPFQVVLSYKLYCVPYGLYLRFRRPCGVFPDYLRVLGMESHSHPGICSKSAVKGFKLLEENIPD